MGRSNKMGKITIKWGKEKYEIELPVDDDAFDLLQGQLFGLTNVPPERQKIIAKGKMIKDSNAVKNIQAGATVMLMGSADALPTGPSKPVIFQEDLTDFQKADLMPGLNAPGLKNLQNTCYMNSVVQCLKGCTELKEAVKMYSRSPQPNSDLKHALTKQLGDLFQDMDMSAESFAPASFLQALHAAFPIFAERNQGYILSHVFYV